MAYSTVSQLGYMFMALGAGVGNVAQLAVVAAMFHLFTHAFFKALLFLASGSVMHAMGGVIDMRRFRGLRHRLPLHLLDVRRRRPGAVGDLPVRRVLQQGRDPGLRSSRPRTAASAGVAGRVPIWSIYWIAIVTAVHDRLLHRPRVLHDLLRPREAAQPRRPRGASRSQQPTCGTATATATIGARPRPRPRLALRARVAAGHDVSR